MMQKAAAEGYAVGAFNIVNELTARAVVKVCEQARAPVILQTSTATVKQIGVKSLIGFLRSIAENTDIPVSVHLDHCKDLALCRECIDAGWPSIMIDASHLPLAENIAQTREIVLYAAGKGVSVEGELGAIMGVEDDISVSEEDAHLAAVEDSIAFVTQTGVDIFAPAIGTAHGLYKGEPKLSFTRFEEIRAAVATPLVVHGGTGLAPGVFKRLIGLGASKINISTALKIAYLGGIKDFMAENPGNSNPLKLDLAAENRVMEMAREHIEIFGTANRL
jgi:fructose-bisphosphate aldolase class II